MGKSSSLAKTEPFTWNERREKAAIALARGATQIKASSVAGVSRTTIQTWLTNEEFTAEVDRLAHMVGIAARAERLKEANRLYRMAYKAAMPLQPGKVTLRDLLDLLKYAQSETDGAKLDLANLLDAFNETDPES